MSDKKEKITKKLHELSHQMETKFPKCVCMDHSQAGYGPDEHVPSCAVCGITTATSFLMLKVAVMMVEIEELKDAKQN